MFWATDTSAYGGFMLQQLLSVRQSVCNGWGLQKCVKCGCSYGQLKTNHTHSLRMGIITDSPKLGLRLLSLNFHCGYRQNRQT